MVGALFGDHGIEAPRHIGAIVGIAALHGDLLHHGLHGGFLAAAAEGHQNAARTDGRVKALGKALSRSDVQVGHGLLIFFLKRALGQSLRGTLGGGGRGRHMLFRTVRIQKFTGNINDRLAVPGHHEAFFLGDGCHNGGLQVFLCGK